MQEKRTPSHKKEVAVGTVILLLSALIWGFAFPAQSAAGVYLRPFTVNTMRFFIGFLVLVPTVMAADKLRKNGRFLFSREDHRFFGITRREWLAGALCGLILAAASGLQQFGLSEAGTGAGNAAFITSIYIVIVPVFSLLFGGRPGKRVFFSACIAILGFYLMTVKGGVQGEGIEGVFETLKSSGFRPTAGDLIVLACAIVFSFHILVVDHEKAHVDGFRISMIQFLTASVLSAPLMLTEDFSSAELVAALPFLLYLGVLSCGVAYTGQIIGQRYTQPTVASMLLSLESVFGLLGGALFLHEKLGVFELVGCGVVFFAILLSQLPSKKEASHE